MDSKPFYTSKIFWGAVVSILAGLSAIAGHHIDPGTQQVLVSNLSDAADVLVPIVSSLILYWRTKPTPPLTLTKGPIP